MLKAATILATAVTTAALFAGCIQEAPPQQVGDDDDGTGNVGNFPSGSGGTGGQGGAGNTGGMTAAQSFFNDNVYAIYAVDNLCTTCHIGGEAGAPMIMGASESAMYDALENRGLVTLPANSLLMTYGQHTGAWVQASELSVIEQWLEMEAEERGLVDENGDPVNGITLEEALDEFSKCMSLDDWTLYNLDQLPTVSTGEGPCIGCHLSGQAGCFISTNTEETFDMHSMGPFWYRLVLADNSPDGVLLGLKAAARYENKGSECQGGEGVDCHPPFSLPPQIDSVAFVQATLDKLNPDGTCPTPAP